MESNNSYNDTHENNGIDRQSEAAASESSVSVRLFEDALSNDRSRAGLRYRTTSNGAVRIGYRGDTAVYCRDHTGVWDSNNGRSWTRRGTDELATWRGSVAIEGDSYTARNSDSGVTTVIHADGTTTATMVAESGACIRILTDANGVPMRIEDAAGTWTSCDGCTWRRGESGEIRRGRACIDRYGQYLITPEGQPPQMIARSRELGTVLAAQEQLTMRYGVIFPQPGESIGEARNNLICRPPLLDELRVLANVLERNRQLDVSALQICFVQHNRRSPESGWGSYDGTSNRGRARVILFPANTIARGWNGLEGTLHHELVHHEQFSNWGDIWMSENATSRRLMRDLGWIFDRGTETYRLLDCAGNQWKRHRNHRGDYTGNWIQAEPRCRPARMISNDEMRRRARVRPATSYFDDPWEMHAEALALFRHDRFALWRSNRDLYRLMRENDQQQINRRFGTERGQPLYIRGSSGEIVQNTAQHRRQLERLERSWSTQRASGLSSLNDRDGETVVSRRCCCRC